MRKISERVTALTSNFGLAIGVGLTLLMVLHVSTEIVARNLFGTSLPGTIEVVSYYYMIALAFVPLGYVQDKHEQIEAEAMVHAIPSRWRKGAILLGFILSVVTTIGLLYASIEAARISTTNSAAVLTRHGEIPTWPGRWLISIGFAAMLLTMLHQLFFRGDLVDASEEHHQHPEMI